MSRTHLHYQGVRALITALILTIVFGLGSVAGGFFLKEQFEHADHDDDESGHPSEMDLDTHESDVHDHLHEDEGHEEEDHEHEEDHVALTAQAYANLDLKMGSITRGDYWKTLLVPGRVVEIPGQSNLSIPASVTGVVEQVNLLPGQTLDGVGPLFTIRITDKSLIDAQSRLLELLTRQEVAEQEIARLDPLISSGAVSGAKTRELQYEVKQLKAQESAVKQELRTRGMAETAIEQVVAERQLETLTKVYAPDFSSSSGAAKPADTAEHYGYSIEDLMVYPGKSVERGEPLCTIAYHSRLYLEGTAFPDDLPVLQKIIELNWKIDVSTHHEEHGEESELSLDLLRVDNHVDEESQTVKFYLELPNEVMHSRETGGSRFEQWRFRPGQRLHLRLPVEKWTSQLTLPVDAVVVDGPNIFVFVEHHHEEDHHEEEYGQDEMAEVDAEDLAISHGHEDEHAHEHDVFIELEPIPVHMLYRDDRTVVIADDGQLSDHEEIALNNAYKLYLAMKMQAGGGGGHHHHHDH